MTEFQPAFEYVMTWEDPKGECATVPDVGGQAISGINSAAYPEQFAAIEALSQEDRPLAVENFYQTEFWAKLHVDGLLSQDLANRVMDQSVNGGLETGPILLQRTVGVEEDGDIGPLTLAAVNAIPQSVLLPKWRQVRLKHYQDIVTNKPQLAKFLPEWMRRAEA